MIIAQENNSWFVGYIRFMVKHHTSDIRMTYEWHTVDIRVHTSDIRMTYEYIWVTFGWHEYIRLTYGWHTNTYCFGLFTKIKKESGISFWCTFSAWIFQTNAPYLIVYQLIKFQRHIFLQDIKQNVLLSSYLRNWDVINFKIYLQSSFKKVTEGSGMRESQKYKSLSISRTKRTF